MELSYCVYYYFIIICVLLLLLLLLQEQKESTGDLERVVVASGNDAIALTTHHVDGLLMSADRTQQHKTALLQLLLNQLILTAVTGW